jgi:release factor glutamine methyltransferase
VTLETALQQGTEILVKAGIPVARLTAEVLLCHALRCDRAYLFAHSTDELTELAWIHFGRYLNERLSGKPTQYITQRQEFFGRDFFVNADVLIPRPETEHLVEAALAFAARASVRTVIDVGTGSGAIAVSLAQELQRTVLASDVSIPSLAVAARNVRTHAAPVALFACDLLEAVQPRSIDLLISNPPYVPSADSANMQTEVRDWEPQVALFAGDSGFEIYTRLIEQAAVAVRPRGRIYLELGYRSLDGVREMLVPQWTDFEVTSDLAGWPRVIGATLAA